MSTHPNIPEDVAALITAHALGVLEPDQAALAEEHIAASDDCRRAYEDALETAAALALAVADSEPPAELRDRIVAAARAERARAGGRPPCAPPPSESRRPADALARLRRARCRRGRSSSHWSPSRSRTRPTAPATARRRSSRSSARRTPAWCPCCRAAAARRRPRRRRAGPCRDRELDGPAARGTHLPGLGPAVRRWDPVPLPTFSQPGDVLIVDDVGSYAQLARHGRAERRLADALGGADRRRAPLAIR